MNEGCGGAGDSRPTHAQKAGMNGAPRMVSGPPAEGLLGGFVLGFGEVGAVDGDEEEVLVFEGVEGGGVAGAGDGEGVAGEAGDGDEFAGGEHGVAEGFVVDAGVVEGEVDAGLALGVGPGAVGGGCRVCLR